MANEKNIIPVVLSPRIRAMIEEARALSSDDYRRIEITLKATLGASVLTANDKYTVPSTHKLLITEVLPHVASLTPATEAEPQTGFSTQHVANRLLTKAQNCRVTLTNNDSSEKLLGYGKPLSLGSLVGSFGKSLDWREEPHIVASGSTIQMDLELISSASGFANPDSEYGLALSCILVRTAR